MNLIKRLDRYRLERKLPQDEIAWQLGVSKITVIRWMNRESEPNKINAYHIKKLVTPKKRQAND